MISCKKATTFIVKKEEGGLSAKQRLQLWLHLSICSLCKLFMKQNKVITNTFHNNKQSSAFLSQSDKNKMIELIESAL